jgi:hypothetical protein
MYPYQYTGQAMYPFNSMMYGSCPAPLYYPDYQTMHRFEDKNDEKECLTQEFEDFESFDDTRNEGTAGYPASMQMPSQYGKGHAAQPPSASLMQPGMMQPGMTQPSTMPQIGAVPQDTFSAVLKQIQLESPQILSTLIALGISIENMRQIILRIIEAASQERKAANAQ